MELFVLQKCWFSGPHHEPSVDCLRLFTSRREAEEAGFHSAHEFANRSIFTAASTNKTVVASVKTILLPPSARGANSSSYAFQTCGKLFWVRALQATVVSPGAFSFGNSTFPYASAQAVVTKGIIGGTGNPNSRRGAEVSQGRVFVSMDNSQANRRAVEVAGQLQMNMAHNPNANITVVTLPIGKPEHGAMQDWPQPQGENMSTMMEEDHSNSNKREWMAATDPQLNSNLSSKRQCQLTS